MPIFRVEDHAEQAHGLLLEQYRDRPRLRALLESYVDRCQELEDAAWDTLILRLIDNAENAQLDTIGRIVGEERKGRTDEIYRLWIKARIAINKSHGHPADIINVLRIVEPIPFLYQEHYPATVVIEFLERIASSIQDLHDIAEETAAAGVRVDIIYSIAIEADEMFSFSTVADEGAVDNDQSFGLSDGTTGGHLAMVVT